MEKIDWKNTLNTDLKQTLWNGIEEVIATVVLTGHRYFTWNGWVYESNGKKTDMTVEKLNNYLPSLEIEQLRPEGDEWYNSYNHRPFGWLEVDEKEYSDHLYFHYILKPAVSRQIQYDEENNMRGVFSARIYFLDYANVEGLGCATVWDWKSQKMRYFRVGDHQKWDRFVGRFAAQFAGDNS